MEVTSVQNNQAMSEQSKPSNGSSTTPFKTSPSHNVTPAGSKVTCENGSQAVTKPIPTAIEGESTASTVSTPSTYSSASSTSNSAKQTPTKKARARQRPRNGQQAKASTPVQSDGVPDTPTKEPPKNPCRLSVTGYPSFVKAQDLHTVFSNYGQVKVEHVGPTEAVITLGSKEQTQNALKDTKQICLYGEFLELEPFTGNLESLKKKKKDGVAADTLDPHTLPLAGAFGEQAAAVVAAVRLTQGEVAALATLYADVERALRQPWPGCQAMPFGSITTGLGMKGSDADCFVDVPPQYRPNQYGFVNRAKRVLLQHPQLFSEVFAIPRANTPIVKLRHVPTRTRCDLSFKTPLGALNSQLVAFLLHADHRYVPLAILLKYWAAVHALSGTGRLANYALSLLLVFYLQSRKLLPSVAALQSRAPPLPVDSWNAGFSTDRALLPPNPDVALEDLLGGFFAFYAAFDFDSLVVCPFLGAPVAKSLFADPQRLPREFDLYAQNVREGHAAPLRHKSPLCVQDPFEQSHNVTSPVTPRLAVEIRCYIKFAADAYERGRASGCEDLLKTILLEKPQIPRVKPLPEYRVNFYPRLLDMIVHEEWKATFLGAVLTIFEGILKLRLSLAERETCRNGREKERYTASLTRPLWKRNKFARLYDSVEMGFIDKHTRVTEEVMRVEQETAPVEFQLVVSFCVKYRSAWVSIRMTGGDVDAFYPFGKYYLSMMQTLVMGVLHENGDISVKENLNKLESLDAIDSNVVNDEFQGDGDGDDAKVTPSKAPNPKHGQPSRDPKHRIKQGSQPSKDPNKKNRQGSKHSKHPKGESSQFNRRPQPTVILPNKLSTPEHKETLAPVDTEAKTAARPTGDPQPMEIQASNGVTSS